MKTIKELEFEIEENRLPSWKEATTEEKVEWIKKLTKLETLKEVLELGEPIHDCNEECKGYRYCDVQESIIIKKSKITGK